MNRIIYAGAHPRMYNVLWHEHDYWELVYCTGGEGAFQLENGTLLPYRAGECIAIPPNERHTNVSQGGFSNIYLTMAEPSFPYRSAFRVEDDQEQHLKIAFDQVKYYFFAEVKRKDLLLVALGHLIASYLVVFSSNRDYSEPVEAIRLEIMKNYTQSDFALEATMRAMPFHYDYLRKLFKKEVGVTPLEFLTNLRMKKAESIFSTMWSREYSMAAVAEMCGFEDAMYFSRVFKKNFGCSPSNYMKKLGKSVGADEQPQLETLAEKGSFAGK